MTHKSHAHTHTSRASRIVLYQLECSVLYTYMSERINEFRTLTQLFTLSSYIALNAYIKMNGTAWGQTIYTPRCKVWMALYRSSSAESYSIATKFSFTHKVMNFIFELASKCLLSFYTFHLSTACCTKKQARDIIGTPYQLWKVSALTEINNKPVHWCGTARLATARLHVTCDSLAHNEKASTLIANKAY
jgi:hypothetical protein